MSSARYRVYARDVLFRNLGEIPDYAELKAELRFNDNGGWVLSAAANSRAAQLLTPVGGIIITRDTLDGSGPSVVFSGPVTDWALDAERIEVAGASDELLLLERAASPDPTADGSGGDPYATEQDLREGIASTVMLAYVNANAGPGAIARRRVAQLTLGIDLGIGSYIYGQARWIGLLALLQELALAGGGLRFRVLQSDLATGQIEFTVSRPADRSGSVVISQGRSTLGEWQRRVTRPIATYVYILGQGQGVNRQVVEGGNAAAATTYGRYAELVADRRDSNDTVVLTQTRDNLLAENGEARIVTYTPLDGPAARWGIDYDLGDLVTVLTPDGEELVEVVRGVTLTLLAPGASAAPEVQPIVSTPGDTADDPASRQERAVNRRVGNLERNIDSLAAAVSVQWNIGDYRMTSRAAAAAGWLLCDGAAVSRTIYDALFGVIGTTYGVGDGSTTFTLPDLRDRFPIGKSGTKALGSTGGAATVDDRHSHLAGTLTGPLHTHDDGTYKADDHTHEYDHTHEHEHDHYHEHYHEHTHTGTTGPADGSSTRQDGANAVASTAHDHDFTTEEDTSAANEATTSGPSEATTSNPNTSQTDGSGVLDVTGESGEAGDSAVTGATASGGNATLAIVPPYLAVNFEIYAGV